MLETIEFLKATAPALAGFAGVLAGAFLTSIYVHGRKAKKDQN